MPRSPKPRWWWLVLSLAPACAPAGPSPTPLAATPSPSTSPSSPAPSLAPSAHPSSLEALALQPEGEEPEALPSDSYDPGDTSTAEGEELRLALAEGGTELYLPGDLIHDGGVILYHLTQADGPGPGGPRQADPTLRPGREDPKPPGDRTHAKARPGLALALGQGESCLDWDQLPETWQRSQFIPGGRHTRLRKEGPQSFLVQVEATNRGSLRFVRPQQGKGVEKRYNERFHRDFRFQRLQGKLQLQALGPILLDSQGPNQALAFQELSVQGSGQNRPLITWRPDATGLQALTDLPTVPPLSQVVVSLKLSTTQACPPFLFAHFLSQRGARERIPLRDDGLDGDATANDGRFSALISVPAGTGLAHLAVEALASSSFLPKGKAEGSAVGLSLQVRAPEASPKP